uniref:Uncharacterized protein n=1 Tax=viral metagenome TaxID=1070528 RepID=A0A6C0AY78_9ZZZZ
MCYLIKEPTIKRKDMYNMEHIYFDRDELTTFNDELMHIFKVSFALIIFFIVMFNVINYILY